MQESIKQIVFRILINNFIMNALFRIAGIDRWIYGSKNPYLSFRPSETKSVQENAGYSDRPEINEVLRKSKRDLLDTVESFCHEGDKLLDVGCGPGFYLDLFSNSKWITHATDINPDMLANARNHTSVSETFCGSYIHIHIPFKYKLIYCIGVLVYIPPYDLKAFFGKLYDNLEDGGVLYLNYPHALSWLDVVYNDMTYVQYSPNVIEQELKDKFDIVKHEHAFDGRTIGSYDEAPYQSLNPNTNRTYKNSYLLIAKKK